MNLTDRLAVQREKDRLLATLTPAQRFFVLKTLAKTEVK